MGEFRFKFAVVALLALAICMPMSVFAHTTIKVEKDTVALRITGPSNCATSCDTSKGLGYVSDLISKVLQDTTMRNWLDIQIRSALDDNSSTVILYDKTTWGYQGGYEAQGLVTTCTSIPLLGNVCINLYLENNDTTDGLLLSYLINTGTPLITIDSNAQTDRLQHSGDDTLDLTASLRNLTLDILVQPPWTATWDTCDGNASSTCINNTATQAGGGSGCNGGRGYWEVPVGPTPVAYDPNTDASAQLALYGDVQVPYVDLAASVRLVGSYDDTIHPHIKKLGLSLSAINLSAGLSLAPVEGPFCGQTAGGWTKPATMCPWNNQKDRNNDGFCNRGDDPTYDVSTQLTDIVPWIDAELNYLATGTFSYPNPSWYFGPMQLLDLGDLIADDLLDHPLTSATGDYIMADIGLTMETWADTRGAFFPGSLGLDVWYWWDAYNTNQKFNFPTEALTTCVTNPNGAVPVTIATSDRATFPANFTNATEPSTWPWIFKWAQTPTVGSSTAPYHIGVGLHKNRLSNAVWDLVTSGILCLTIDGNTPTIGSLASSFLTTDGFTLFMPELDRWYPSKDMRIRIQPLLYSPATGLSPAADRPYLTTGQISAVALKTGPYQTSGKMPGSIAATAGGFSKTPDISLQIPHLAIAFDVDTTGAGGWQKAFGLDIGAVVGIDLEITRNSSYGHVFGGHEYPKGCTPCGSASCICTTTGRFLRLGMVADPSVNWFFTYLDQSGVFASQGYTWDRMNGIFGNIIPVALSGVLNLYAELGLDVGQFIGAPFTIDAPYIGYADPTESNDPVPGGATYGEWFGLYLTLVGQLNASIVVDLISSAMGGGLFAPPSSKDMAYNPVYVPTTADLIHPETYITSVSGLDPMFTAISFTGKDLKDNSEELRYSWRLDGAPWTPFVKKDKVEMGYLLEGKHSFEVMSINSDKVVDPTPASFTFRIDSQGPTVNILQDGLKFVVDAKDYQTPSDLITVSYRVDGGEWSDNYTSKAVYLKGMSEGSHLLEVKATDDVGNSTIASHNFNVGGKAGFGCSTVSSNGSASGMIQMLVVLLPGIAVLVRRLSR